MPITKRQFELGIDDQGEDFMRQMYEILAADRGSAYSRDELRTAVLGDSLVRA